MQITAKIVREITKSKHSIEDWILDSALNGDRVYWVSDDEITEAQLNRLKKKGFKIKPRIETYSYTKLVRVGKSLYKRQKIKNTSTSYAITWK